MLLNQISLLDYLNNSNERRIHTMKHFEMPAIAVVEFAVADVITTSVVEKDPDQGSTDWD